LVLANFGFGQHLFVVAI